MDDQVKKLRLIIGTYALADEESIFLCTANQDGKIEIDKGFKAGEKPSFIAWDEKTKRIFAINETEDFEGDQGAVASFLPGNERPEFGNRVPSQGKLPVHVRFLKPSNSLLVCNYTSGSVAVFPVHDNGRIGQSSDTIQHTGSGPNQKRQSSPHAHQSVISPDGRFVFIIDLGLDEVRKYSFNNGRLESDATPVAYKTKAGFGPRQMVFHPDQTHAFLVHEIQSVVTFLKYDPQSGTFGEIKSLPTIPFDFKNENKCGSVKITPDGKMLYVSNRGHDSIASFSVDVHKESFELNHFTPTEGKWPRDFCIDPKGELLVAANQKSDTLTTFKIDPKTNELHFTGNKKSIRLPVFCLFY